MKDDDLYERLRSLSKSLESSGRIDEHESRDAYPTILDAMNFVAQARRQVEVLHHERDSDRARVDNAVKLLTGIHSLLYPPPLKTADGRTMVFRPADPDPHEVLQSLSGRIRALPDEMAGAGLSSVAGQASPESRTIEEMARQAGLTDADLKPWMTDYGYAEKEIKAFAALVAQQENEACAKTCEDLAHFDAHESAPFAAAIRARSTAAPNIPACDAPQSRQ